VRLADGFGTQREQSSARFVAVSAVLVIHLLLALLFLRASLGPKVRRSRGEVLADILNLVRLPQQAPRARGPIRETEASRLVPKHLRSLRGSDIRGITLPGLPGVSVPQRLKTNWYHSADEEARSLTSARRPQAHPGSGELPTSPYRDCTQQPQFAWDPQPTVVGLDHHLVPYLRLGKWCVITLGALGCVFDDFPAPNGHLFDSIREGDAAHNGSAPTWSRGEPRGLCQ